MCIKMLTSLALLYYFNSSITGLAHNSTSLSEAKHYNQSQLSSKDAILILAGIDRALRQQLLILHESKYKDVAVAVTRTAFELDYFSGLTIFKNDEKTKTLQLMFEMATERTLLMVLCTVDNVLDIFLKIREERLQSYRVQWLLIFEEGTDSKTVFRLEGIVVEGTQIVILQKVSSGTFRFFSNYLDRDGTVRFAEAGEWTDQSIYLLSAFWTSYFNEPMMTLNGRRMTMTTLPFAPFMGTSDPDPQDLVQMTSGIDGSIVKSLSQMYNFTPLMAEWVRAPIWCLITNGSVKVSEKCISDNRNAFSKCFGTQVNRYRVFLPSDRSWGYPQPDGTITGMVGVVARREADFAIACIGINEKRKEVIDFSVPYYQASLGIFSRAPKERNRALAVLSPFTLEVWLSLIFVTLAMGPILTIQAKISEMCLNEKSKGSLASFALNSFRNMMNQGNRLPIQHWSHRCLFSAWYLFCLLVSALYSGTLIAVLAVPAYEKPIDYLTDLPRAVEDGFTLTVTRDSSNEYIFRDAEDGIYKEVWGLFNHEDRSKSFVSSPAVGLKMILEGKFLHIAPEITAKNFAAKVGKENVHFAQENFFAQNVAIAIPPGVPYKKAFNWGLSRMLEAGLIDKFEEDEFTKISGLSSGYSGQTLETVITLVHLQASFFILILGFISATVVLLLEKVGFSILKKHS